MNTCYFKCLLLFLEETAVRDIKTFPRVPILVIIIGLRIFRPSCIICYHVLLYGLGASKLRINKKKHQLSTSTYGKVLLIIPKSWAQWYSKTSFSTCDVTFSFLRFHLSMLNIAHTIFIPYIIFQIRIDAVFQITCVMNDRIAMNCILIFSTCYHTVFANIWTNSCILLGLCIVV